MIVKGFVSLLAGFLAAFAVSSCGSGNVNFKDVQIVTVGMSNVTVSASLSAPRGISVVGVGADVSTSSFPATASDVHNGVANYVYGSKAIVLTVPYLAEGTAYYLQFYVMTSTGQKLYDPKVISFVTKSLSDMISYGPVDLGLSVRWASTNVGSTTPEGYGNYFAWADRYCDRRPFEWNNYCHCSKVYYENDVVVSIRYGSYDSIVDADEDAATALLGPQWRMPTQSELQELEDGCEWRWGAYHGVNGYYVISRAGDAAIFLPAAGYYKGYNLIDSNNGGYYWTSSLRLDSTNNNWSYDQAWSLYFNPTRVKRYDSSYFFYGFTIRPVCK